MEHAPWVSTLEDDVPCTSYTLVDVVHEWVGVGGDLFSSYIYPSNIDCPHGQHAWLSVFYIIKKECTCSFNGK